MNAAIPPYQRYDRRATPVTGRAVDYVGGHLTTSHEHPTAQLIYAVQGVMVVGSACGQWTVPPTRGIWMPAGVRHWTRMVGDVKVRTVYIQPDAAPTLPTTCMAVHVSPLLRELIVAATAIDGDYTADSRNGRLMRLLLDEIATLPTLPLHLPQPADPRLAPICETLDEHPDDPSTLADWSARLGVDAKTIQRQFSRETGMTFGQWRQQARLLKGLEELASGRRVLDVALALGYDSPSAFTAMFKRQFGETPTGYFR